MFKDLLFRRAEAFFCAFDGLWLDGKGFRHLRLIERKRILRCRVSERNRRLLILGLP